MSRKEDRIGRAAAQRRDDDIAGIPYYTSLNYLAIYISSLRGRKQPIFSLPCCIKCRDLVRGLTRSRAIEE